jgi:hypothetical protein
MTALRVTLPSVAAMADALCPSAQRVFSCSTRSFVQLILVSKIEKARAWGAGVAMAALSFSGGFAPGEPTSYFSVAAAAQRWRH